MRRAWLLAGLTLGLIILLAGGALGAEDSLREAYDLNEKALELYRAGRHQEALPLAQRALELREKGFGPEHPHTANSINTLAYLYKDMGDYDKALALFQRALKIREQALGPESPDTANSFNALASIYTAMGAYEQALPLYQRALAIKEKVLGPEDPNTATSLNNLAELYRGMGAYDQALPLYKKALGIYEKAPEPEDRRIATCLNNLALLYEARGAYKEALPFFQRSLQISEKSKGPEHPETAATLNNLAELYRVMGAFDQALPLYKKALGIFEKNQGPEHPLTATSLNNLALLYEARGAYEQALPLFQRAIQIDEKVLGAEHPETATTLSNLAELYRDMGAYDQALPLSQRALKIREKALGPEHPRTALSLNNLADLYCAMGASDRALPLMQQALSIKEKVLGPRHTSTRISLSNLGKLYLDRKDYATAETYFRRSENKAGLAGLALAQGQPEEALKLLQDTAPTWLSPLPYQVQYYTQSGLALAGVGRWGEASQGLLRAVQGIEDLRRRTLGQKAGFFQAGAAGGYLKAYLGLVSVLAEMALKPEALPSALKAYGPDAGAAAFYFAEATKGRILLETLAAAARQETRVEIPAELRQQEDSLLNQLAALEAQWERAMQGGEAAVKEIQGKKAHISRELTALIQKFRQKYPLYAALHYPEPLPARDLPLQKNEVLLEYALGEAASYVMVVRRGGLPKVVRIPLGREALAGQVKGFMKPFLNVAPDAFSLARAKKLFDLLLAGVLPEIKESERVIIVPDGILGLLPFEALVLQQGTGVQDSVFVGDKYSLTYYQSATVLALKRRLQTEQASRPLFALGNPIFNPQDERCQPSGREAGPSNQLVKDQKRGSFQALATSEEWGKTTRGSDQGQELEYPPLKETEDEVQAIAGILGVEPKPPDVLLNLQANETTLKQSPLGDYRRLHFATHADLPGKVQGIKEPFILLGQVGNQPGDNGFLTLSKVLGLKLRAETVVLSACVTGRGQVMEGEGVANFARAFQHAGAQSVVVSLWEVANEAAVEYMTLFYGHLKEGKSRSEALKLARQAIKIKYPQPFFWAVFILHGEG